MSTEFAEKNTDFLWDCLADIADMKFYIEKTHGVIADEPAILLRNNEVYLNRVGKIGSFRFRVQALRLIKKMVEQSNFPMRVWLSSKPRRGQRPFAENSNWRIPENAKEGEGVFIKAFNLKEAV